MQGDRVVEHAQPIVGRPRGSQGSVIQIWHAWVDTVIRPRTPGVQNFRSGHVIEQAPGIPSQACEGILKVPCLDIPGTLAGSLTDLGPTKSCFKVQLVTNCSTV